MEEHQACEDKEAFRQAAATGWQVWVDNQALEILDAKTSQQVRNSLRRDGEFHKILCPRYVYTDKNDGVRTSTNPLPVRANGRLVVPGFKDPGGYEVRKDAPTASRTSQHLIFLYAVSMNWDLWSADIKSAFLKGEIFLPGERELFLDNIRTSSDDEPRLPLGEGCLARLRKGMKRDIWPLRLTSPLVHRVEQIIASSWMGALFH